MESQTNSPITLVALLAEGVDRNNPYDVYNNQIDRSPSSRRAWIEIWTHRPSLRKGDVALLAEGVDRNRLCRCTGIQFYCRPPRGGRG